MDARPNPDFETGMRLYREARFPEALERFDRVLAQAPANAQVRSMRGLTLCHLGDFDTGIAQLRAAVELAPREALLHIRLGMILFVQNRLQEAHESLRRALAFSPNNPDALSNLSLVLRAQGDPAGAERAARAAATARPGYIEAGVNLAYALLEQGKFAEAWRWYCTRPDAMVNPRSPGLEVTAPHASALPVPPAPVIVHGEQGLGDALFFLRFAPLLRARGHPIAFWGDARLHSMLARSGAFAHLLKPEAVPGPGIAVIWAGDLPHLLAMDAPQKFPAALPLAGEPARLERLRAMLRQWGEPPYIGLTWRAGLERQGSVVLAKEIELALLGKALSGKRATWVSLQRGAREGELARLATALGAPVHDAGFVNADLEEALALLQLLDEYAGVSNTNTHLRASLGKPARVLVPWPAEWRWQHAGERSPFFPAMPLYRQRADGDWDEALARLASGLSP